MPRYIAILLAALAALIGANLAQAQSDAAREKRIADQILPALVLGEPVWIQTTRGDRFLGLYTEKNGARTAILLLHGRGSNPDEGLIGALRVRLADAGFTTLAIQLPVLAADAAPAAYAALFPQAEERIAAAVAWLSAKGYRRIALVSHSLGSRMANHYIADHPRAPLCAWVAISISNGQFEPFGPVSFPVYDVYGERDLEAVRSGVESRRHLLAKMHGSSQTMVFGADHFFAGKEKELAALIDLLLEGERG